MNKSSLLLLPTVLAVSTSARSNSSASSARTRSTNTMRNNPDRSTGPDYATSFVPARKSLSIDLVFNLGK